MSEKSDFYATGVTGDGVEVDMLYSSECTGPDGAHYTLLKESHHTTSDIQKAKEYIRANFDVVSLCIVSENKVNLYVPASLKR